ncbi:MAG: hypothetical protein JW724_04815 [Candidatus Altiarchaeota archaeon]|nr:hypothetical protein [Candidatus Altiarchaeota archaeon]
MNTTEPNPIEELRTVHAAITKALPEEPEFKAAVGLSREWDAYKAGREVAQDTLSKLGTKPDFFLLFSTIHYEKHGGFKEFLKGVWEVLPDGTPLIGGTVAGFINNQGCYTRGATALAVSYPNMNVGLGIGHNTKKAPRIAAKECASMINKKLENSTYTNKFYLSFVSGGKVPPIPWIGKRRVIKPFFGLNVFLLFFDKVCSIFQIGPGRDEDVFEELAKNLKQFKGIGGTCCDDLQLEKNTQFFMKKTFTNSVVSMGGCWNKEVRVSTSNGLNPSGKKFSINKRCGGGYILKKINNKSAVQGYLEVMGWSKDLLDERLYRKVFYYPFIQKSLSSIKSPRMLGLVYGNKFICAAKPLSSTEAEVYTSSGKSMIESINKLFTDKKQEFSLFISCGTKMETLGERVYQIKNILDEKLGDKYLLIYSGGEFLKLGENEIAFMYQSDNAFMI